MVATPAGYPWSSHTYNRLVQHDFRITAHFAHLSLGANAATPKVGFLAICANTLDEIRITDLRLHTQQQRIGASEKYRRQIELLTGRIVEVRPSGHPNFAYTRLDK